MLPEYVTALPAQLTASQPWHSILMPKNRSSIQKLRTCLIWRLGFLLRRAGIAFYQVVPRHHPRIPKRALKASIHIIDGGSRANPQSYSSFLDFVLHNQYLRDSPSGAFVPTFFSDGRGLSLCGGMHQTGTLLRQWAIQPLAGFPSLTLVQMNFGDTKPQDTLLYCSSFRFLLHYPNIIPIVLNRTPV